MSFRAKNAKVRMVALRDFRGPEGARGGDRQGLVRKGQIFEVFSMVRASKLMKNRMAEIYKPAKPGPSVTRQEEPALSKSEDEEEKPKKRGRKSKEEEPVDESDSG